VWWNAAQFLVLRLLNPDCTGCLETPITPQSTHLKSLLALSARTASYPCRVTLYLKAYRPRNRSMGKGHPANSTESIGVGQMLRREKLRELDAL
jgi:hypothetical protein